MANHPVRNCKCFTLSALAASLAVSVTISIVLIEMSPAHIYFSIVKATHNTSSDGGLELSIALAANNSSPRSSAFYRSIYVVFCNKNNTGALTCIGTDVAPMPLSQKPNIPELIHAAVVLEGADSPWVTLGVMPSQESFIGDKSFDSILVNVSAVAMFKRPGIHWTSLHDINVSCGLVTFISQANQSSAGISQKEFNCN